LSKKIKYLLSQTSGVGILERTKIPKENVKI